MTLWIEESEGSRLHLALIPLREFSWWTYVSFLAFHGILAAIIAELMGRSYGKWWLWLAVALAFPIVGPIAILLYHLIASSAVTEARRKTFWERVLFTGPVSLLRAFQKEQARAREITLRPVNMSATRKRMNGADPELEQLIEQGKFNEARGLAWKMIEIARQTSLEDRIAIYMEYLEIIALKEASESGIEISKT